MVHAHARQTGASDVTPPNIDAINPDKKEQLIASGRHFGSPLVKAQGEHTLAALLRYETVMANYGFTAEEIQALRDFLAMYPENLQAREVKQVGRTLNSRQLQSQTKSAKAVRLQSHGLLGMVSNRLHAQSVTPEDEAGKAAQIIDITLSKTAAAPKTTDGFLSQLRLLAHCWTNHAVANEAAKRGGVDLLGSLQAQIAVLEATQKDLQHAAPTAADTQRLDLIDGLIIERVREARRIAKTASKASGDPALADAFKLTHLDG